MSICPEYNEEWDGEGFISLRSTILIYKHAKLKTLFREKSIFDLLQNCQILTLRKKRNIKLKHFIRPISWPFPLSSTALSLETHDFSKYGVGTVKDIKMASAGED